MTAFHSLTEVWLRVARSFTLRDEIADENEDDEEEDNDDDEDGEDDDTDELEDEGGYSE